MLRQDLTNEIVEVLLNTVDELGRTQVSEDAGINRAELTRESVSRLKLYRLVRMLVVIDFHLQSEKRWRIWWNRLGDIIFSYTSVYSYYKFVDENRKRKSKSSSEPDSDPP